MPILPITGKLLPTNMRNLAYLGEIAAFTRLAYGGVRVWENRPNLAVEQGLSKSEGKQRFWERVFVELIGTSAYLFFLHLGQDLVSKMAESKWFAGKAQLPLIKGTHPALTSREVEEVNKAITRVYGEGRQGLIHRVLYEHPAEKNGKTLIRKGKTIIRPKASLATLAKELEKVGGGLLQKVQSHQPYMNELENFARLMNRRANKVILSGVLLSAVVGGFVTQWMNDRLFAPFIHKSLQKKYKTPVSSTQPQGATQAYPMSDTYQPRPSFNNPATIPFQPGNPYYESVPNRANATQGALS